MTTTYNNTVRWKRVKVKHDIFVLFCFFLRALNGASAEKDEKTKTQHGTKELKITRSDHIGDTRKRRSL